MEKDPLELVDQYILAVGRKLPLRGREEIKQELKSRILDEIETKYGPLPGREDIEKILTGFGAPGHTARKYTGERYIIAPGFTDLYLLIISLVVFALFIAFTTVFAVELFTENLRGTALLRGIGRIFANLFNTALGGIGSITLIFMGISRFYRKGLDLEEDWTPKELKGIEVVPKSESKIEAWISIFFAVVFLVIINLFPGLIPLAENSYEKSGLLLGNTVNLEVFRLYARIWSAIWLAEIVYHILILKNGMKTQFLTLLNLGTSTAALLLMLLMINDPSLYLRDTGWIGFKTIFLIVFIVSSAEVISETVRLIRRRLSASGR